MNPKDVSNIPAAQGGATGAGSSAPALPTSRLKLVPAIGALPRRAVAAGTAGLVVLSGAGLTAMAQDSAAASAAPATVRVADVADTYSSTLAKNMNYGTSTRLSASNMPSDHKVSYLRFNVPTITGTLISASVVLTRDEHHLSGSVALHSMASSTWSEKAVTAAAAPVAGAVVASADTPATAVTVSLNVTSSIKPGSVTSYALTSSATADVARFQSREAGAAGPQLVLVVAPIVPVPTSPAPTSKPAPTSSAPTSSAPAPTSSAPTSSAPAPTSSAPDPTSSAPTSSAPAPTSSAPVPVPVSSSPVPVPPAPASQYPRFTLDFATNSGLFSGTQAQLGTDIRSVYKGSIGPDTKFYDGGQGILATIRNLQASGFSVANGDSSPYVCYRPQASDADLRTAFTWLVTNFPNQPIYLCHDQEPENKLLSAAQYIAKTDQEFRVRSENPVWQSQIKIWPCLMGYQETNLNNQILNWKTLVLPSVNEIDGMSWDIYQMDWSKPSWDPATYIGPMLAAAKVLNKPSSLGEWGTTVTLLGGDTEAARAVRTQAAIDYMKANSYDPATRPWGIQWAAWWENYKGIAGSNLAAATGLVAAAMANPANPPATLAVLLKAAGRS